MTLVFVEKKLRAAYANKMGVRLEPRDVEALAHRFGWDLRNGVDADHSRNGSAIAQERDAVKEGPHDDRAQAISLSRCAGKAHRRT